MKKYLIFWAGFLVGVWLWWRRPFEVMPEYQTTGNGEDLSDIVNGWSVYKIAESGGEVTEVRVSSDQLQVDLNRIWDNEISSVFRKLREIDDTYEFRPHNA